MRIVGYIEHPIMKITLFRMGENYSLKCETGQYEQIFKFRTGESFNHPDAIRKLVDEGFLDAVMEGMQHMRRLKAEAIERNQPAGEPEEFDEII